MEWFQGKNVVVGITGGISAYKSCELVRSLVRDGAEVRCVMTANAERFITPLTLQTLSGNKVASNFFDLTSESEIGHIKIADEGDVVVVAPASASFIGKIASGIADSLLATVILATRAPVIICPAMNSNMYSNSIVQENMEKLRRHGFTIVEPEEGDLACGWTGRGRLAETDAIALEVQKAIAPQDYAGENILVSAGATREHIDPVRFISNPSTGKMGYSIARAAWLRGARVTLVSGHSSLPDPHGVKVVRITDCDEMYERIHECFELANIVIKSAAVSDYSPREKSEQKIKKSKKQLSIPLKKTRDILKSLGENKKDRILVGFAAETENIVENSQKKLKEKNLDLIVANDVTAPQAGFGEDTNIAWLVDRGKVEELQLMSKFELANRILDRIKDIERNRLDLAV
ncbi:MAG: bifunctional phosphopantothenoylcysteine decarboxylase/phosphopantothenate--cysteine ligase CoaBC [Candidatus Dadabacteria bacterium]|nr:bifunctional phosphopantothenoylcysteine decarboxylase/phosphopantothenate--cysteine ligase CoaBC [Candidatus Dadabacteria bacterium]